MFLPRSMGGPELDPLTVFRAIEELSRADGSIGWCAMLATDISLFMGWLSADVGRQFSGEPADFRAAGSLRPLGRAHAVDGGYRVHGRWNFASGIDHANRLYCTCLVTDGEKPQLTAEGTPRVRAVWLPPVKQPFWIHGRQLACAEPAARTLLWMMSSCPPPTPASWVNHRSKPDRYIGPGRPGDGLHPGCCQLVWHRTWCH